jgi:hypothetical protein
MLIWDVVKGNSFLRDQSIVGVNSGEGVATIGGVVHEVRDVVIRLGVLLRLGE